MIKKTILPPRHAKIWIRNQKILRKIPQTLLEIDVKRTKPKSLIAKTVKKKRRIVMTSFNLAKTKKRSKKSSFKRIRL